MDFLTGTKKLQTDIYQLEYPEHYSFLDEGAGEITGFLLSPPHTIGVLRLSVYTFPNTGEAKNTFENSFAKFPKALRIDVNGMDCMFDVQEKQFSSNDYLFWNANGEPISMYIYSICLERHLFFFSYRIPAYMEDDGNFDYEHPVIMKAIGSLRLK
jgi:hypothetical protein